MTSGVTGICDEIEHLIKLVFIEIVVGKVAVKAERNNPIADVK